MVPGAREEHSCELIPPFLATLLLHKNTNTYTTDATDATAAAVCRQNYYNYSWAVCSMDAFKE